MPATSQFEFPHRLISMSASRVQSSEAASPLPAPFRTARLLCIVAASGVSANCQCWADLRLRLFKSLCHQVPQPIIPEIPKSPPEGLSAFLLRIASTMLLRVSVQVAFCVWPSCQVRRCAAFPQNHDRL